MTKRDAIVAAMSVAEDVDAGRLDPAALERQVVAELFELCGTVVGPDDPIWELQVRIARGVLAAGGIPADEQAEWLAVSRRRDGVPDAPPQPIPIAISPEAPDDGEFDDVPDAILDAAEAASMAVIDGYRRAESVESHAALDHDQPAILASAPTAAQEERSPCQHTPVMVATADGGQIPNRLIAARGRGLPHDNGLRPI